MNAKMNDAKKTGDVPTLQSVQKLICSKFHVVVQYLVTPSRDLPHPILPKLDIRSPLIIMYKLEPVRHHALLDFMYGMSQMIFEGKRPQHWSAFTTVISQPTICQFQDKFLIVRVSLNKQHYGRCERFETLNHHSRYMFVVSRFVGLKFEIECHPRSV